MTNQLQRLPSNRPPINNKFEDQKKIKSIFYINRDFEKIKHILCMMYTQLMHFLTISFYTFFKTSFNGKIVLENETEGLITNRLKKSLT